MTLEYTHKTMTVQKDIQTAVVCDICHERYKGAMGFDTIEWPTKELYEIAETSIMVVKGHAYPDCASKTTKAWHVCPKCFEEYVEPFLESLGAKPTERRNNW